MSDYERYSPANVVPFEFAEPQQIEDVLREVTELQMGKAANGQKFSIIHANRAYAGDMAIVRFVSLFGSNANADQQYIASQYAAAFPEQPYLSIDLPAHGASDKLTKDQRKSIKNTDGSLAKIADAQVEAVLDVKPDLKDILVTGEALGELFSIEFVARAAEKGLSVKRFFGIDPLGMESRSPLKLASGYLANAQKSRNQRRNPADDAGEQYLEDAFSKVFVPKVEPLGPVKYATQLGHAGLMARERTVLRLMFQKSPITRETGMRALEAALYSQPQLRANLIFAGRSVVGQLTDPVRDTLDNLKSVTGERIEYDEWPDDNQDIGLARHQPRLIKYVKDKLQD